VTTPRRAPARNALGLTAREAQIVRGCAVGLTRAEIGDRLGIAPRTVQTHLEKAYRVTGFGGKGALPALTYAMGVADAGRESEARQLCPALADAE